VNTEARLRAEAGLRALKIGLLFMAGLPLLAVIRPTSSRTTFRERSQAMSQGQRPEIDLISLARHVPLHGESKKTLTKGESQWMQSIAAARCVVFYVWPSPRVSARVRSPTQSRPCRSPWKKASGTRRTILKSRFKPSPAVRRGAPAVRRPAPFPVRAIVGTVVGSAGGTGAVGCVAGGSNGYRISSQFPETKSFVFAFPLPLTRLSICLCVARAATEASKLPIASDGVFLRRAA
jgi:hypothetical protein